jgi:3-oxoacyl-[acyl-carrier-protein] synthase II
MNSGIDKGNEGPVYINAHGTGTPLNDAAETRAIKAVMGGDTKNILVSSTKSMTGHMLGAAGAVEAIISILALTEGVLPPTAGLYEPDPECDLDYIPLTARKASPELAMTVSPGFGGHNACLAFAKGKNNG